MKILLSGDVHGNIDIHKLSNSSIISRFGTLPDALIVAGDFGNPWSNNPDNAEDNYYRKWYEDKPYEVLVVPGNHENYSRILAMPEVEIHGARAHKYGKNMYFIKKNEVLSLDGLTFYCFGGAMSSDKEMRIIGQSWWPEEDATYTDFLDAQKKLETISGVDCVITHTCPERWVSAIGLSHHTDDNCPTRKILDWLEEHLEYQRWFFGHFHRDIKVSDKGYCIFNKLIEITTEKEK